jgi:hypothetical protein
MLVNHVKLLELIVVNLLQNHVHVQLCTMKIILKNVVLVIGDVMIVIPITKMDNYVTLVVISELETVVSVQLKDTSLMMLIKSKNVKLVIPSVELVVLTLQVDVLPVLMDTDQLHFVQCSHHLPNPSKLLISQSDLLELLFVMLNVITVLVLPPIVLSHTVVLPIEKTHQLVIVLLVMMIIT